VSYLCQVTISGPEPDAEGVDQITAAVSDAVQAGWDAPRVDSVYGDEADPSGDDDSGEVLDYRVLGYPGGVIILIVLDSTDLMQTSVAATGLAQHLTKWTPSLLEYSPDEIKIAKLDEPYCAESCLPPLRDENDDERARWPMAALLGEELQDYLPNT
jgi:hypothetical protein